MMAAELFISPADFHGIMKIAARKISK